jgi:hypothetical protein
MTLISVKILTMKNNNKVMLIDHKAHSDLNENEIFETENSQGWFL